MAEQASTRQFGIDLSREMQSHGLDRLDRTTNNPQNNNVAIGVGRLYVSAVSKRVLLV
ncbi:MAG: hypothetical protein JSS04_06495 [Proteobacteria bacterium]|nr:hypothetical protein [Pseudomonadota bacterium]